MSDTLIGFVGKDYVMVAADTTSAFSIILMKDYEDKIMHLDSHKALAASGEAGDRVQFTEYIQKNLNLYAFKNGKRLDTEGSAHYIRLQLAEALRKNPYSTNLLLGGWDKDQGPSLYYIDYLSSMQKMNKAAHGYGSYFSFSIMDRLYKPDMTVEEGMVLMDACIAEVQKRLILNSPRFTVKLIDKDGIRIIRHAGDAALEEKAKADERLAAAAGKEAAVAMAE